MRYVNKKHVDIKCKVYQGHLLINFACTNANLKFGFIFILGLLCVYTLSFDEVTIFQSHIYKVSSSCPELHLEQSILLYDYECNYGLSMLSVDTIADIQGVSIFLIF